MKQPRLTILLLLVLLGVWGCQSRVPMVEHHEKSYQTKVQALAHWREMAEDSARRIAKELKAQPPRVAQASVVVEQPKPAEPAPAAMECAAPVQDAPAGAVVEPAAAAVAAEPAPAKVAEKAEPMKCPMKSGVIPCGDASNPCVVLKLSDKPTAFEEAYVAFLRDALLAQGVTIVEDMEGPPEVSVKVDLFDRPDVLPATSGIAALGMSVQHIFTGRNQIDGPRSEILVVTRVARPGEPPMLAYPQIAYVDRAEGHLYRPAAATATIKAVAKP